MQAEQLKHSKYTNLESKYDFVLVAVENFKASDPETCSFFKALGHQFLQATLDPSSHQNLIQQLSAELQGNIEPTFLGSMGTDVEDLSSYIS